MRCHSASGHTLIFSIQFPLATYHRKIVPSNCFQKQSNYCFDELPETREAASIELVFTIISVKDIFLPLGPYSTALHIPKSNVHGVHPLQDYMEIADMLLAAALEK